MFSRLREDHRFYRVKTARVFAVTRSDACFYSVPSFSKRFFPSYEKLKPINRPKCNSSNNKSQIMSALSIELQMKQHFELSSEFLAPKVDRLLNVTKKLKYVFGSKNLVLKDLQTDRMANVLGVSDPIFEGLDFDGHDLVGVSENVKDAILRYKYIETYWEYYEDKIHEAFAGEQVPDVSKCENIYAYAYNKLSTIDEFIEFYETIDRLKTNCKIWAPAPFNRWCELYSVPTAAAATAEEN